MPAIAQPLRAAAASLPLLAAFAGCSSLPQAQPEPRPQAAPPPAQPGLASGRETALAGFPAELIRARTEHPLPPLNERFEFARRDHNVATRSQLPVRAEFMWPVPQPPRERPIRFERWEQ